MIQPLYNYSQEVIETVEKIEDDTIYAFSEIYDANKNLCEKRYFRQLKSRMRYSKEHMFILGMRPAIRIDSMILNVYDKDWEAKSSIRIIDKDEINKHKSFKYSPEQIVVEEHIYRVKGKTNTKKFLEIEVSNLSPQDFELRVESKNGEIAVRKEPELLSNRSSRKYQLGVNIGHGIKKLEVIVSNSNGIEKIVKIETVGYDFVENDFTDASKNIKTFKVKRKENFLIENGNKKLLVIRNKSGVKKIPFSKLVNILDGNLLDDGLNKIELIDLATNKKVGLQIKIK